MPACTRAAFYRRAMESLYIRHKDLGILTPFRFNESQEFLWQQYLVPALDARAGMRLLILKARQVGISTMLQALLTVRFIYEDMVIEKVIAHEGDSTRNVWRMADTMLSHSVFGAYVNKVGTMMELGGSRYSCATAGSPHATRSMNLTVLHPSEVAFWPHPEAWLAAMQTISHRGDTWVFSESTPNGKVGSGKLFYDEWTRAIEGKTKRTKPIFLPFFLLREYELPHYVYPEDAPKDTTGLLMLDELDAEERELRQMVSKVYGVPLRAGQLAWRRLILEDQCRGNVDLFRQEYPSTPDDCFIQSGLPLFSSRDMLWYRQYIQDGKRFRLDPDGRFLADPEGYVRIWQSPEPGHRYIIGADTSMGFTDDRHSRSAAEIIDVETLEQVGEYDCASPTHVMARHLAILGRRYNNALLAPEITASGGGGGRELLVYLLKDHHYYHIYRYKHVDHIKPDLGRMYGWETNMKTRPRMISRVIEAVSERAAIVHSAALLQQMQSFGENDTGRMEALAGHDDLFFAWGIALTVRSEEYLAITTQAVKTRVTARDLQDVGLGVQPDLHAAWDEEWSGRYHRRPLSESAWLEA